MATILAGTNSDRSSPTNTGGGTSPGQEEASACANAGADGAAEDLTPSNKRNYQERLSFAQRRACVAEALARYGIHRDDLTGRWRGSESDLPEYPVRFEAVQQFKYLKHVHAWSRDQVEKDWAGYAAAASAKTGTTAAQVLQSTSRLPTWWLDRKARKREAISLSEPENTTKKKRKGVRRVSDSDSTSIEVGLPGRALNVKLAKSRGSKPKAWEKWPALLQVIRQWNCEHEEERALDNDVSFVALHCTFGATLERARTVKIAAGEQDSLPKKVSLGWFVVQILLLWLFWLSTRGGGETAKGTKFGGFWDHCSSDFAPLAVLAFDQARGAKRSEEKKFGDLWGHCSSDFAPLAILAFDQANGAKRPMEQNSEVSGAIVVHILLLWPFWPSTRGGRQNCQRSKIRRSLGPFWFRFCSFGRFGL
jgi:hypothetical protein